MKSIIFVLVVLLIVLQYRLWFGDGNLREVWRLEDAIASQQLENEKLRERNAILEAEVKDLKQGLAAIEGRARSELGMIKKGETFFRVLDEQHRGETKTE